MLLQIKKAFFERGYRLGSRPFELNIVGIRINSRVPNTFDDLICVCYTDNSGKWHLQSWPATTDPGTYWLRNPMNPQGTAILKPGQYTGSHAIGLHRGKYKALVQVAPVTVYRGVDRTGSTPDFSKAKQDTGLFGINIHRAMSTGTTKTVDAYSAGCQVFSNADDFAGFLQLCDAHRSRYGNSFTYTLLLGFTQAKAVVKVIPLPAGPLSEAA